MQATSLAAALLGVAAALPAAANVQITEWMYNPSGAGGEFVELTNMGSTAVALAGWVYDDDSRFTTTAAGAFSLSALGTLAPGESAIFTESTAADFRAAWGLDASVKVVGGVANNLGRNDEINVFDASGNLVDRLTYGDQNFAGTLRTQGRSGNPLSLAALTPLAVSTQWAYSANGDAWGSHVSSAGDIGNPGHFALAPVPEPQTVALMLAGLGVMGAVARRRSAAGR